MSLRINSMWRINTRLRQDDDNPPENELGRESSLSISAQTISDSSNAPLYVKMEVSVKVRSENAIEREQFKEYLTIALYFPTI